ncbi:MAG: hypothetical protein J6C58_06560 [Bacteroidaceae bacterium]|nr:hypothetical protein [Bacteroidaceae bacterium]
MKKIFSLVLLYVFAMSFFSTVAFSNSGDQVTVYAVADKTQVEPGDTLTVTLKVENLMADGSESSKGMQFRFDYDSTKLEYESKSNGAVLRQANTKSVTTKTVGQVGVMAVFSKTITVASGDLVVLNFTVKDGATGTIDFSFRNATGEIPTTFGTVPSVSVVGQVLPTVPVLAVTADKESLIPGETITYSFDLSKVSDFQAVQFDFDYDENKIEFISRSKGEIFNDAMAGGVNDADGIVTVVVTYDDVYEFEGNICTLTFQVKANATGGRLYNTLSNVKSDADFDVQNSTISIEVVVVGLEELTIRSCSESDTLWYYDVIVEDYPENAVVYAASYTTTGEMLTVGTATFTPHVTTVSLEKDSDAAYIKLFVWTPDFTPMAYALTLG